MSGFLRTFTSESVTEGHPDKIADAISDAILDACLERDSQARVAIETMCSADTVFLGGEVACQHPVTQEDLETVVRQTVASAGYNDPTLRFNAGRLRVHSVLGTQSRQIASGVGSGPSQGAGDQGMVFGFACDETETLMPMPIHLAHKLTRAMSEARRNNEVSWLLPDGKAQVSVAYDGLEPIAVSTVVMAVHHRQDVELDLVRTWIKETLIPRVLQPWCSDKPEFLINRAGPFHLGGPEADCGMTGRKLMVDTYGGYARHGGGAFSGKDASKVDRSAAYFARYVAREIVLRGLARLAEVQVAYAIGHPEPVSLLVDTRGTGDDHLATLYARQFDFRPGAIIERLKLLSPLYCRTTNYGHMGRPGLAWERGGGQ